MKDINTVTRVEYIGSKGREFVKYLPEGIRADLSFQDDQRTLKIFEVFKGSTPIGSTIKEVYHAANPYIRGIVSDPKETGLNIRTVMFDTPVSFSGNTGAGFKRVWHCSPNLLFSTPEEALEVHDPNYKEEDLVDSKLPSYTSLQALLTLSVLCNLLLLAVS